MTPQDVKVARKQWEVWLVTTHGDAWAAGNHIIFDLSHGGNIAPYEAALDEMEADGTIVRINKTTIKRRVFADMIEEARK